MRKAVGICHIISCITVATRPFIEHGIAQTLGNAETQRTNSDRLVDRRLTLALTTKSGFLSSSRTVTVYYSSVYHDLEVGSLEDTAVHKSTRRTSTGVYGRLYETKIKNDFQKSKRTRISYILTHCRSPGIFEKELQNEPSLRILQYSKYRF